MSSTEIIIYQDGKATLANAAIQQIKTYTAAIRAAKKAEEEMKEAILAAMEAGNVDKLENEEAGLTIIRFPETVTKVFDQGAFCKEQYDLYEAYCTKERRTKSYIKIATKEPKDAEA